MPVFTRGETLERLDEYYSHTDYIMFGGIVIGGQNKNYVKWFLNNNKGRKALWLGFVNVPFIKHYKPESADSSSWMAAARFGRCHLYDGHGDVSIYAKTAFQGKIKPEVMRALRRHGLNDHEVSLLGQADAWRFSGRIPTMLPGAKDITSAAQYVTTIGHVWRSFDIEKNLGTKVYLAISQVPFLKMVFAAREFLLERKVVAP